MRKVLLTAAWGGVDTTVLERSAAANAPDWEVVVLRPPAAAVRPGYKGRWGWYANWLGEHTPDAVLTVDARDTVVQGPPVDHDRGCPCLHLEPCRVREEPWNLEDYTRFALKVMASTAVPQNPPVVNGGFVSGAWHAVALLCAARFGLDLHHGATDQASLTALRAWFPGLFHTSGHGDGGQVYHGHWHATDGTFDDRGRALRPDGTVYPVFHQWDRVPGVREKVLAAYGSP